MYLPGHFRVEDRARIVDVMRRFPLALLTTAGPAGLLANPVPMLFDEEPDVLRAHVARANPVWRDIEAGAVCLAVFQGTNHYVSPGWYPSKADTHKVVPTWNYAVVQARGSVRTIHDADWLHALVGRLTGIHEAGRQTPWSVSDAPADFIDEQLKAIVGLEMTIESLEGKFKMSQNRSAKDRDGVAAQLDAQGDEDSRESAALVRALGRKD